MVTLAIAAILATLAAPNFSNIIANNRMVTQINELNTSLSVARSEAIKRNATITLCKSTDQENCAAGDWDSSDNGWIVFVDNNSDNDAKDDGEEILRIQDTLSGSLKLKFNNDGKISYRASGLANKAGTFTLCDQRSSAQKYAKALIINNTGRIRKAIDNGNNGIVDSGNGSDVDCS